MEELKREMSPLTYGAALISSVAAVAVARFQLGQDASFHLANPSPVPLRALPLVVVLGVSAAFAGVLFNKLTIGLILARERMNVSRGVAGATVGMLAGACLVLLPQVTGGGHSVAETILSGGMDIHVSIGFVALLFLGKLVLTSSSFATGVPGGIFAPILVIGSLLGYFCGSLFASWFPGLGVSPHVFATIGMASLLSASVRAPLTGIVLIVEMTQQYSLLYALLLGAFISYLIADLFRDRPIYDALLEHDLHKSGELGRLPESTVPVDLVVEPDSYMDGRRIKDLGLTPGTLIVTIEREGGFIVPNGSTKLRYGDHVAVILGGDHSEEAALRLHDGARAP
jgi:CIC family chloride channel protein